MNLKGLKISKKVYKKLNEIDVKKISNKTLMGLDEFKQFSWEGFQKQEFEKLIYSLNSLDTIGLFSNISEKQLFIFNYNTDVTEMDIVTVLKNELDEDVVIDIEYKSGDEADEKLDKQINKRIKEHMPQLFINNKYIIIGMDDTGFYKANYYDGNSNKPILDISKLKDIFESLTDNEYVETILTQANDLAGIHKLYGSMEKKTFNYYEETTKTVDWLLKKYEEGKKAIVIFANPGTGKTVMAFKLFFENENTRFLIMNEKFYKALNLKKYFPSGRCFYGSDTFLSQKLDDKISIIDEAQRLSKETILKIIKSSMFTVIFGDCGQAFMDSDLDLDETGFFEYLKTNDVYVASKRVKRSKRYNNTVEKALYYLTNKSEELKDQIILQDYNIKLYYDINDFLKQYHDCKESKKIFTTFDHCNERVIRIGDEVFEMAERDFAAFAIVSGFENYIGHTLHAISFDVDHNYVYLNNVHIKNRQKKNVLVRDGINIRNELSITKFLNELNILFTRGKKSLNIYVDDFEVYLFLNRKLKDIIQK